MKKLFIIASLFIIKSAAPATAQRTLRITNNNSCGVSLDFTVVADVVPSTCGAKSVSLTLPYGGSTTTERIADFNTPGGGPLSWTGGGSIASGYWVFSQVSWVGVSGGTIGSPNWLCGTVPTSLTISGTLACPLGINLTWTEDAFGNVRIDAL